MRHQKGVLANTKVKLALTAGALGATAYSRLLGQKVIAAQDVPIDVDISPMTPEVAKAQKQLKALQWAIPGLTGAVMASSALHEEQQRPSQVLLGSLQNLQTKATSSLSSAGPALERGRAAAVPALERGVTAASSAYDKAVDKVKDALPA